MLWGGRRDFLPGSQGVLAAYVLERITGQSWEAYTRTRIFVPLGMTTASFGPLGLEQANRRFAKPTLDDRKHPVAAASAGRSG